MNWDIDITFAGVVAEQFDEYAHAEVLFYPVGGVNGLRMPDLTLGAWLETEWRLSAATGSAALNAMQRARAAVAAVRARVPALVEAKARREFKSRLDSMAMWLEDLPPQRGAGPDGSPAQRGYLAQVHLRLKAELLASAVTQPADQLSRLRAWDIGVRGRLMPGPFLLEPEVAGAATPPERFWFLFGGIS